MKKLVVALFLLALVCGATLYVRRSPTMYVLLRDFVHGEVDVDVLRTMLLDLLDVLESAKVVYWIDAGTLLGAYRDGDIVDKDRDADVSMMIDEAEKMWENQNVHRNLVDRGYKLVRSRNNNYRLYKTSEKCSRLDAEGGMPAGCLRIDIRQFKQQGKCLVRDCFFRWRYPCDPLLPVLNTFATHVLPLQRYNVAAWNKTVLIPAQPDLLLEHMYGPTWRTPLPWGKNLHQGCKV